MELVMSWDAMRLEKLLVVRSQQLKLTKLKSSASKSRRSGQKQRRLTVQWDSRIQHLLSHPYLKDQRRRESVALVVSVETQLVRLLQLEGAQVWAQRIIT